MRRIFSSSDPARIARCHNLRRRTAQRRVPFQMPPGLPRTDTRPPQANEEDWRAPFDEEEMKALRAAWSFVE